MALIDTQNHVDAEWIFFHDNILLNKMVLAKNDGQPYLQSVWSHSFANIPTIRDNFSGGTIPDQLDQAAPGVPDSPNDIGIVVLTDMDFRWKTTEFGEEGDRGFYTILSYIYFSTGIEYQKVVPTAGTPYFFDPWREFIPE
jgi:hypothetical protein